MKIKDCRESYYYNTGKASDICRNLGFAGLALIWALRITTQEGTIIPDILRWAGVLLVLGLALDFLQYIFGTIVWGSYHRIFKERKGVLEEKDFLAPFWINYPANTCFVLKQISIFIAFVLLVISMFNVFWK